MADEDRDLIQLVNRGFAGIAQQLSERDDRVSRLSDNIIRMEGDLKALTATLIRIDTELSKAETEGLRVRVSNLEATITELKKSSDSNDTWIRGLMVSIIFLLAGVVFNFVMARAK